MNVQHNEQKQRTDVLIRMSNEMKQTVKGEVYMWKNEAKLNKAIVCHVKQ